MSKTDDAYGSGAGMWPEGMLRAEIRQLCTSRLALLSGDAAAAKELQREYSASQFVHPWTVEASIPRGHMMRDVERHMVADVMLKCWDEGYWPVTPLVVRWYRNTNVAVGSTPILQWVEQSS